MCFPSPLQSTARSKGYNPDTLFVESNSTAVMEDKERTQNKAAALHPTVRCEEIKHSLRGVTKGSD